MAKLEQEREFTPQGRTGVICNRDCLGLMVYETSDPEEYGVDNSPDGTAPICFDDKAPKQMSGRRRVCTARMSNILVYQRQDDEEKCA